MKKVVGGSDRQDVTSENETTMSSWCALEHAELEDKTFQVSNGQITCHQFQIDEKKGEIEHEAGDIPRLVRWTTVN